MNAFHRNIILLLLFTIFCCTASGQTLIPFQDLSSKWGYKNSKDEIVIQPQYKVAKEFQGKYAIVFQNDSTEVIDSSRGLYFPLIGAIDTANNLIVPIKYHYLQYMGNEQFVFGFRAKYFGEYFHGVITTKGKQILSPVYNAIYLMKHRYFVTLEKDTVLGIIDGMDFRGKSTLHGLNDEEGREIIPCKYMGIRWASDSILILTKEVGRSENILKTLEGLYTASGAALTPFKYIVIDNFKEGLAKVRVEEKYGFVDSKGQEVIPVKFQMAYPFEKGIAMIKENDLWGAININGETIIPVSLSYQDAETQIKSLRK